MYGGGFPAIVAWCESNGGLILGGMGEKNGLAEGDGVARAFEVAGEELIEGRVGVGSAEVPTMYM